VLALAGIASSGLTAVAASRTWGTLEVDEGFQRQVVAEGTDVAPLVLSLALVCLAAWGAVLVLRRRIRRIVAAGGLLAALGALAATALAGPDIGDTARRLAGDPQVSGAVSTSGWYVACLVGALVSTLSFAAFWWLAPALPEMGSRYDAPGDRPARPAQQDPWKALDEGRDPTV
jgi:uncharacterized membrane protein (TIGR02234 family)